MLRLPARTGWAGGGWVDWGVGGNRTGSGACGGSSCDPGTVQHQDALGHRSGNSRLKRKHRRARRGDHCRPRPPFPQNSPSSPVCRQFARPQLALLFGDYLGPDLRSILYFSPPDDQRVSVTAKLGVARGLALGGARVGKGRLPHPTGPAYGSMALRFEPDPRHPYTFFDVKTGVLGTDAALAASIRGCFVDAGSGLAAHAQLPIAAGAGPGPLLQSENLRVGARYTSPGFSVGAMLAPSSGNLEEAWIVRWGGGIEGGGPG